jgi:hypothetical protein
MHESVIRTSWPVTFPLAVRSFLICTPGVKAADGLYCERALRQCASRSFEQLGCISGIVEEYIRLPSSHLFNFILANPCGRHCRVTAYA